MTTLRNPHSESQALRLWVRETQVLFAAAKIVAARADVREAATLERALQLPEALLRELERSLAAQVDGKGSLDQTSFCFLPWRPTLALAQAVSGILEAITEPEIPPELPRFTEALSVAFRAALDRAVRDPVRVRMLGAEAPSQSQSPASSRGRLPVARAERQPD